MSNSMKEVVKDRYGKIARDSDRATLCCCPGGCCSSDGFSDFSDDYQHLGGYNPDADLGLGCGLPTEFAGIAEGDAVLDLGSGAGNDCFVARSLVGEAGSVTGLDFTDEMLALAQANNLKMGYQNVHFVKGDIEEMPLPADTFDVVISNCVLNLVPDKQLAFAQIFRVLKPGGHFCVSDVVVKGDLPPAVRANAELYAGCVSGAINLVDYQSIIARAGFHNIAICKEKPIEIPDSVLLGVLSVDEFHQMKNLATGLYSVTVTAHKPL